MLCNNPSVLRIIRESKVVRWLVPYTVEINNPEENLSHFWNGKEWIQLSGGVKEKKIQLHVIYDEAVWHPTLFELMIIDLKCSFV